MLVVVFGTRHGKACRHSARNNRDLVHRFAIFQAASKYRVPRFVISGDALVMLRDQTRFFGRSHFHFGNTLVHVRHSYLASVVARREYCRFVETVFQVRSGKAGGYSRYGLEIHRRVNRLVARVNL